MATKATKKATGKPRGLLEQFTTDQQDQIMSWLENESLSYPDAAKRAQETFGQQVKPYEIWHFEERHVLSRQLARSLFAASSLASISDGQRQTLEAATDDKMRLRIDALLDESLRGNKDSDRSLALLRSALDSSAKVALAKANHELNVKADLRAEQSIVLQAREQARREESLKLDQARFEAATRIKDKVRDLAERAGMTAEERDEFERDLKIL